MTTTLLQLRDRCKQESDNVGQSFVSDSEWNTYINASYQELYGIIVQAFGNDYFVQSPASGYTFTTDGVNQFFNLPSDFFKLLGVDLLVSSPNYWVSLTAFTFQERNRLNLFNNLVPMAGQQLRMFYVPRATVLVSDSDSVDGVNGWEEFIVVDASMKASSKEESDVSVFMARKQALQQRLDSEIENRNAAEAGRVADVLGLRSRAMQYRLNGNQIWLIGNGLPAWGPYGYLMDDGAYWSF